MLTPVYFPWAKVNVQVCTKSPLIIFTGMTQEEVNLHRTFRIKWSKILRDVPGMRKPSYYKSITVSNFLSWNPLSKIGVILLFPSCININFQIVGLRTGKNKLLVSLVEMNSAQSVLYSHTASPLSMNNLLLRKNRKPGSSRHWQTSARS